MKNKYRLKSLSTKDDELIPISIYCELSKKDKTPDIINFNFGIINHPQAEYILYILNNWDHLTINEEE